MKYRSKIDIWLAAVIIAVLLFVAAPLLLIGFSWMGFAALVLPLAFVVDTYVNTYYMVCGEVLIVRCGFLMKSRYNIREISRISATRTLISSPALSLDRLCIKIGRNDEVIISPADRKGFIDALLHINPDIDVMV